MEDVDEGFGSNESNHSSFTKETILTDLKYLNGQSVLDKKTNGNNFLNGNILKNGCQKGDECLDKQDESIGFSNSLRDQDLKNCSSKEHSDLKELSKTCIEQRSLSSNENENSNCSLDNMGKVEEHSEKISLRNKSVSPVRIKEDEVSNKLKCSKEEEMHVQTETCSSNSDKTSNSEVKINENEDSSENSPRKTVFLEIIKDKGSQDNIETIDRNSLNKTPVKQGTSSAEGERSPFLLDDKVRNSLKGLVAKVKSSELSRESMSPAESSVSVDTDELASEKLQEDEISMEEETDTKDSVSVEEECNLDDCEDGISMEIGSENEDDLLEIDSELSSFKKCNNEKKEIAIEDISVENFSSQRTGSNKNIDKEDTNSNSAIEIDITSDNEDDTVMEQESKKSFQRFKHASIEKIQFEEDSNSNGNSGKINDIVNFLNHDLSGTNSPLTTSDSLLTGDSKLEEIDKDVIKYKSISTENKNGSEIEMPGESDIQSSEKNGRLDSKQDSKGNVIHETEFSVTKNVDETSLNESEDKEQKLNCINIDKSGKERKNSDSSNSSLQKCHTSKLFEEEKEKQKDEVEDEDDDVIFEGASMPAMRNEYQKLPYKSVVKLKEDAEEKTLNEGKQCTNGDDLTPANDDEDDDVIFEKETKVEVLSKQNCDIENKPSCAGDGNASVLTIENSPSDTKKDSTMIENDSSEKVSVISRRNSCDRKRSAEDKDQAENKSKRSKLDLSGLIGKLGSRVEPASIELSDDSDDEGKSVVKGKDLEDKSTVVKQVDQSEPEKNERLITVTEKELEELVREKVKTYLTSQKDTLIAKLSQKVKDLQQNNDLWKRQVKDLQVKVNDVTVLQQKLEKRKAATAALRQITTRNVSVQVDDGRTSSSKTQKMASSTPQRPIAQIPLVSATGNGTIRLPIQQSQQGPTSQLAQGSKVVTSYQTPSVKSLLDTTRVQKTVGSLTSTVVAAATSTVNTSMIELLPYTSNLVANPATGVYQGIGQPPVGQITTQNNLPKAVMVTKSVTVSKTVTVPAASTAKVIDLTDDDDSNKTRLVTLPAGIGAVTNQQGVRHVLAPPGTQFVRTGLPNQPTYQLVFSSPPAVRPGMMVTVASGLQQTTPLINTVQQSPTLVNLTSPTSVAPGTSLARAAVSATPTPQKAPAASHPAPFPPLPPKQQINGFKELPPKPCLKISRVSQGIVLSWNMTLNDLHAEISNYQLFAYQETSTPPVPSLWKKVGDVKALPLPMACTLTQFQVGNKYHFAVRAMDAHNRVGDFSDPGSIHLTPNTPPK